MASKLEIYNASLRLCGQSRLATLTDNVKARRLLDEVYLSGVYFCLEQALWCFASRSIEHHSAPTIEPAFGYTHAFTKPEDWLRTCSVYSDAAASEPLHDYSFEQEYWYADIDPIYIKYVSNDNNYGMNLGKWPQYFQKYVEAYLASEVCLDFSDNQTRYDALTKEPGGIVADRLLTAQNRNKMEMPPQPPQMGSWARSRSSGFLRSSLRSTGRGL